MAVGRLSASSLRRLDETRREDARSKSLGDEARMGPRGAGGDVASSAQHDTKQTRHKRKAKVANRMRRRERGCVGGERKERRRG